MLATCPKCKTNSGGAEVCPACGLVFRKYVQAAANVPVRPPPIESEEAPEAEEEEEPRFARWFLSVPDEVESWRFYTGAALLAASVIIGIRFYLMDIKTGEIGGTFMHAIMLPFHEFGHILFRPFGEFMTLAGGSLAQWLMPLGFLWLFSFKNRDNLTASLMLWWCGTQFIDMAPYAYDAFDPKMILLTGRTGDTGAHDYIDMLGDLGLLKRARGVGYFLQHFGLLVMVAAWAWGAYILWKLYVRRKP
jgi:hypothetical protein